MRIWLINHYAVPPKYYPLARTANFAKGLMKAGHEVTVFAASTVHNSDKNLIEDGSLYRDDYDEGVHYVYVNACGYGDNGIKRIKNIFQFARRVKKVCKNYPKPDVILASSSPMPFSCMSGIKLAKKYGCRGVAEITDLCPENLVVFGYLSKSNPIAKYMYHYERKLYEKADAVIFSFEGGCDYIKEKGWTADKGRVKEENIFHINNGVDLELFDRLAKDADMNDPDLENSEKFKVVYTGSIRLVNQVDELVRVAKVLKDMGREDISILLYGAGDYTDTVQKMIDEEGLDNIKLKGKVTKDKVPQILRNSDLNVYMLADSPMYKYGLSLNKSFEYFASGKPVLANRNSGYSIIDKYACGVCLDDYTPQKMAEKIVEFADMPDGEYREYCKNARRAAEDYDFNILTEKLIGVLKG